MATMLSEHFSLEELRCKHCGECHIEPELLTLAEKVRHIIGDLPMITHCGYRCEAHNAAVGGVVKSQHTLGRALDFHVKGRTPWGLFVHLLNAQKRGELPELRGLFVYDWGIHIDCREAPFRHADYRKAA